MRNLLGEKREVMTFSRATKEIRDIIFSMNFLYPIHQFFKFAIHIDMISNRCFKRFMAKLDVDDEQAGHEKMLVTINITFIMTGYVLGKSKGH